jgi:hypothetical protein
MELLITVNVDSFVALFTCCKFSVTCGKLLLKKENNILFDLLVEINFIEFLHHRKTREVILSILLPQDYI